MQVPSPRFLASLAVGGKEKGKMEGRYECYVQPPRELQTKALELAQRRRPLVTDRFAGGLAPLHVMEQAIQTH